MVFILPPRAFGQSIIIVRPTIFFATDVVNRVNTVFLVGFYGIFPVFFMEN